ncbi:MAG: aminotransferase [Alphaproteobacteria bacterium]|nr:aminotransferase [Alphaproteobacteria bacterium]|tara:strand:- start:192 stop:1454 length:1263 start_codon:yes stop_codon:yes gene_type:complete
MSPVSDERLKGIVMAFNFDSVISPRAAAAANKWAGYPPFHFVGGNIDEQTLPVDELAAAVDRVIRREGHSMAKYGLEDGPMGYLPLRQFTAEKLKTYAGMDVSADEVLITTGSLQALDLVNELLLEAGDVVVLEAANYNGTLTRLQRLDVEYIGVELDDGGMRMDHLRDVMSKLAGQGRRPKFIYTIPTIQNPTGTIQSRDRRLEMLDVAREFDVLIFEDDCYADLTWDQKRPEAIQALDADNRVLYCGTFSKTIAPALRVGYLVAPWQVMQHVLPLKTDAGSGALEQMVLAEYLPHHFDDHVTELVGMLKKKCDAMAEALDENFGAAAEYSPPDGGIYMWVTLPKSVDTRELAVASARQGVAINPGPEWTVHGEENRHRMRLCFGHPTLENIRDGVAKLADICHQEFGVPRRSGNVERT